MGLDVRMPIGLMFMVLGPILLGWGWHASIPLDIQVGAAMLVFGVAMWVPAMRARRRPSDA